MTRAITGQSVRCCPVCEGRGYTISRRSYVEQQCPVCEGWGGYRLVVRGRRHRIQPRPWPDGFTRQQRVAKDGHA